MYIHKREGRSWEVELSPLRESTTLSLENKPHPKAPPPSGEHWRVTAPHLSTTLVTPSFAPRTAQPVHEVPRTQQQTGSEEHKKMSIQRGKMQFQIFSPHRINLGNMDTEEIRNTGISEGLAMK